MLHAFVCVTDNGGIDTVSVLSKRNVNDLDSEKEDPRDIQIRKLKYQLKHLKQSYLELVEKQTPAKK